MYKKYFDGSEAIANDSKARGVGFRSKNGLRFNFKRLIGGRQQKRLVFGTFAAVLAIVVSVLIFYSCQKDREFVVSKEKKSIRNYSQPVQTIDVATFINIQGTDYPVNGYAVAGNYDGRIYECNLMWEMPISSNEILSIALVAWLKDMINVEPVMENYNITMNGQQVFYPFGFAFFYNGNQLPITYQNISELWDSVMMICEGNVVIGLNYNQPYTYLQNKYVDLLLAYELNKEGKAYDAGISYEEKLETIHLLDSLKADETTSDALFYQNLMDELMSEINSHPYLQSFVSSFAVDYDANDMIIYTGYSDCYDAISKFQILKYYENGVDVIGHYSARNNLIGNEEWEPLPIDIESDGSPKQKAVRYTLHLLWGKTIEYMWNAANSTTKTGVISAMADWKSAANNKISFSEITKCVGWNKTCWVMGWKYFLRISSVNSGNFSGRSTIGRVPWAIMDFKSSANTRTYRHELGHTLGLYHEHQRRDRDTYITYNSNNVESGQGSQFNKMTAGSDNYYGSTFDFNSIMIYDSWAFAKSGTTTLTKKDGTTWYAPTNISSTDKSVIQKMYP